MKRRQFLKITAASPFLFTLSCTEKKDIHKELSDGNPKAFDYLEVKGSYKEIGLQIGKRLQSAIHRILDERYDWINNLMNISTSAEGSIYSNQLLKIATNIYPQYIQEIEGMAEGADIDFHKMWVMTIKNELTSFSNLESVAIREPGCSTIFYQDENKTWLFHNEDGDKVYHNRMLVLKAVPPSGVSFITLVYPGIIAGVGPSINNRGICETTNYIGCKKPYKGIPRYFLGRAVLEAKNLAEALQITTSEPRAYPWHHNIIALNSNIYASVETLPDGTIEVNYPGDGVYIHTNHTLGKKTQNYPAQDLNYKNTSSIPRMEALRHLISNTKLPANNPEKFMRFLSSHKNKPYSPCRHPAGDVRGQTLATAFFDQQQKTMRIYKGNPCKAMMNENYSEYSF